MSDSRTFGLTFKEVLLIDSTTIRLFSDINDSISSMSFVMPSSYSEENLSKPNDPNVRIQKTADEYVAVIRFGGLHLIKI